MTHKAITVLGILAILLVTIFGNVAAQVENPETPPPTDTVLPGQKFFTHPVVQLLSAYFDRETEEPPVDEETPVDPEDPSTLPPEEVETPEPEENESGLGPIGEEIAAYHEEGMGFGVLVKIYAMVEASEEACAAQEEPEGDTGDPAAVDEGCTPLTAEELVEAFRNGAGMGALFKEHGKPALLGVGHVKHELKKMENEPVDEGETDQDDQDDKKNGKPDKEPKVKPEKTGKPDKGPKK